MATSFTLADSRALDDLATFLSRAARVENGSVRLIGSGGVLAVYVAVFFPLGLLDDSPTILGLRTFSVAERVEVDTVVPIASLAARIESTRAGLADAGDPATFTLPMSVNTVTWAAISPPRGGWSALDPIDPQTLEGVARAGIEQVAAAVPAAAGEQIVHRVRSEVWGRPLRDTPHVPAGAAFAAVSLGFLGDDERVSVYQTGPWTRLTTRRGHVLVKRRTGPRER